jgi:hypothetical protein
MLQRAYRGRIARTDVACMRCTDEAVCLCKQMGAQKKPDAALARKRLAALVRLADGGGAGRLTKVANVLCQHGAPLLVLKALETHTDDPGVAEHGCHALRVLTRNEATAAMLGKAQAVERVLECLSKHHAVHGVAEQACSALVNLSNSVAAKAMLSQGHPTASSYVGPILTALRSHPLSPAVLDPGFTAMKLLEKHSKPVRKTLVAGDVVALAVAALEAHPRDADVATPVCLLLMGFASDRDPKAKAEYTEAILAAGAVRAIVEALKPSAGGFTCKCGREAMVERDKGGVLAVHVRAVWALLAASKSPSAMFVELGGIEALVAAIRDFPESESLSYNACCVLWILLNDQRQTQTQAQTQAHTHTDPGRHEHRLRFLQVDGVRIVVESMAKHRDSLQHQEAGCGAILALASGNDAAHAAIKEAGGVDALGLAMVAHPDCGTLHHNVALALEHMKEQTHAEDAATTIRATTALEEARRCWPRGA